MDPLEEARARVRAQLDRMLMRKQIGALPSDEAIEQMAQDMAQQTAQKRDYGASPQAMRDLANKPGVSPEQRARLQRFEHQRIAEAGVEEPQASHPIRNTLLAVGEGAMRPVQAVSRTLGNIGVPGATGLSNVIGRTADAADAMIPEDSYARPIGETVGEFAGQGGLYGGLEAGTGKVLGGLARKIPALGNVGRGALDALGSAAGRISPAAGQAVRGGLEHLPAQALAGMESMGLQDPASLADPRAQVSNLGFSMLGVLGGASRALGEYRNPMGRIGEASEIPQEFARADVPEAHPLVSNAEPLSSPRVVPPAPRNPDVMRADQALEIGNDPLRLQQAEEGVTLTPRFNNEFADQAGQMELERSQPVSLRDRGEPQFGDLPASSMEQLGYYEPRPPLEERLRDMSVKQGTYPSRQPPVPERRALPAGEQPFETERQQGLGEKPPEGRPLAREPRRTEQERLRGIGEQPAGAVAGGEVYITREQYPEIRAALQERGVKYSTRVSNSARSYNIVKVPTEHVEWLEGLKRQAASPEVAAPKAQAAEPSSPGDVAGGKPKLTNRAAFMAEARKVAKERAASGETTMDDFDLDRQLLAEMEKRKGPEDTTIPGRPKVTVMRRGDDGVLRAVTITDPGEPAGGGASKKEATFRPKLPRHPSLKRKPTSGPAAGDIPETDPTPKRPKKK